MKSHTDQTNQNNVGDDKATPKQDIFTKGPNGQVTMSHDVLESMLDEIANLKALIETGACDIEATELKISTLENDIALQMNGLEPSLTDQIAFVDAPVDVNETEMTTEEKEEIASLAEEFSLLEELIEDTEESNGEQGSRDDQEEGSVGQEGQAVDLAENEVSAEDLAGIEPAAGDEGGASASTNSGYGFQTKFSSEPFQSVDDIGPIKRTKLQYKRPEFIEEPFGERAGVENLQAFIDDDPVLLAEAEPKTIDETTDVNGKRADIIIGHGGTIDVDFGNDGPGTIVPNDFFEVSGSLLGGELTTGGVPIVVEKTDAGYRGLADSVVVFIIEFNPENGDYLYIQNRPFDHADGSDPNDVITINFGARAIDNSGDFIDTNVIINVLDDAPTDLSAPTERVQEDNLDTGASISGTIDVDYGLDRSGSITGNERFDLNGATSNGEAILVAYNRATNAYYGDAGGKRVFELKINSDGSYVFDLLGTLDHPENQDVIDLEFGFTATDFDGDSISEFITIQVVDDVPVANDDTDSFTQATGFTDGNVITGDDIENPGPDERSQDNDNTVTHIAFGDETIEVPSAGTAVINGEYGELEIDATGEYTYRLFDSNVNEQTIFHHERANPTASGSFVGGDRGGGQIENVEISYNDKTHDFTFAMILDEKADGFSMAINNGGNPKGHSAEMAMFYFDDTGDEPIISVFAYNGKGSHDSFRDGSNEAGLQAPDKITTSQDADNPFTSIEVTTNANGQKVMSFSLDGTSIMNHVPANGPVEQWSGISFSNQIGIWLHPFSGMQTKYDTDGYLSDFSFTGRSFYDSRWERTTSERIVLEEIQDEFEYTLADGDGDTDTAILTLQTTDDVPVAVDDINEISTLTHTTSGNIISGENSIVDGADTLSTDGGNVITKVKSYLAIEDVPEIGEVTVSGQYGDLNLAADGSYTYTVTQTPPGIIDQYVHTRANPTSGPNRSGGDRGAGHIDNVEIIYTHNHNDADIFGFSDDTYALSFSMILDEKAEGFSMAINGGGNPNKQNTEMAMFYFDASGDEPVISVFAYNRKGSHDSFRDGSTEAGLQAPDKIVTSLGDNSPFTSIEVTTNADGQKVMSFDMDATGIINHVPAHGPADNWTGISFGEQIGVWLHPFSGMQTEYDAEGYLSELSYTGRSYYDSGWENTEHYQSLPDGFTETFDYTITDADGDISEATLTIDAQSFSYLPDGLLKVDEGTAGDDDIQGTTGNDLLYGGDGDDTLYSSDGTDVLHGGEGADDFMFTAVSTGIDVIRDFSSEEGDVLDLSSVIQDYDCTQEAIDDFVFLRQVDGGSVLAVDTSGSGDINNAIDLVALEGVQDVTAQELFESGNINVF